MGYVSFGTKYKESEKQRKNTKNKSSLKHGLKVRDKMSNKSTKATGRGASNAKNNETRAKARMKISAEKLITAAEKSNGIMSVCARLAGINRRTVEKYFELVPEAKNAFMEQREVIIDLAESKLLNMVNAGDKDAVFFLLKTIGKKRGYSERSETEVSGAVQTVVDRFTLKIENN